MGGLFSQPTIQFKYLNFGAIGGRGGVVRFYMLAHGIEYEETLYDPASEWPAVKAELVESGENPAGTAPIVNVGGTTLAQHVAIMRELAKQRSLSSGDYPSDAIADQYQAWRDAWVDAAFMGADKEKFKQLALDQIKVFEALYAKYGTNDTYLAVGADGAPLWGDACLFGLLRDLVLTGFITLDDLTPRLAKMFAAFKAIPAVAAWIAEKEAK